MISWGEPSCQEGNPTTVRLPCCKEVQVAMEKCPLEWDAKGGEAEKEKERESTARHIKAADMSEDAIFEGKLQPQLSQLTPHGSELSSLAKLFVNSWPAKSQTKQSVALCLSVEGNFCCAKDNQNTYTRWTSNYTPICPDKILMPAHPRT